MKRIGMIAAMTSETDALLEKLNAKKTAHGSLNIYRAETGGKELYIAESGVGEIFAAGACRYLISCAGAEAIINFGVCGSLSPEHKLKQTVLVKGVVHYEMDTSAIDGVERGRYSFLPSPVIPTGGELLSLACELRPDLEHVICASGNKFIAGQSEKRKLCEEFKADVCDMESAGIALTCYAEHIPCLIVKAVSDAEGGATDYRENLFAAARAYTDILTNILERI